MKPAVVVLLLVLALSTVAVPVLAMPPGGDESDLDCRNTGNNAVECWRVANCRMARVILPSGTFLNWVGSSIDHDNDNDDWWSLCGLDCDDSNPNVNPSKTESTSSGNCNDGVDNDCDGLTDTDDDDCSPPPSVTLSVSVSGTTVTLTAITNYPMTCRWSEGASSYNALKDSNPEGSLMVFDLPALGTHTKVLTNVATGTHTYYAYCRMPP